MTLAAPGAMRVDDDLVTLATSLVDASGAVIRGYFRTSFVVDDKADQSPVTIADQESEATIRAILRRFRPQDGIIGEEAGTERGDARFVWVIDPIDGTKSFVVGRPIFGTIIGLLDRGVPVLGVIDQPITGDRWVGGLGHPTQMNGRPVRVRPCPALADAIVATTAPEMLGIGRPAFDDMVSDARMCVYGGDCYSYGLLASGFLDAVVECGLKLYDWCGLVPVITGAGGIATDWQGRPLAPGCDGSIVASGDPTLHRQILSRLPSARG